MSLDSKPEAVEADEVRVIRDCVFGLLRNQASPDESFQREQIQEFERLFSCFADVYSAPQGLSIKSEKGGIQFGAHNARIGWDKSYFIERRGSESKEFQLRLINISDNEIAGLEDRREEILDKRLSRGTAFLDRHEEFRQVDPDKRYGSFDALQGTKQELSNIENTRIEEILFGLKDSVGFRLALCLNGSVQLSLRDSKGHFVTEQPVVVQGLDVKRIIQVLKGRIKDIKKANKPMRY